MTRPKRTPYAPAAKDLFLFCPIQHLPPNCDSLLPNCGDGTAYIYVRFISGGLIHPISLSSFLHEVVFVEKTVQLMLLAFILVAH